MEKITIIQYPEKFFSNYAVAKSYWNNTASEIKVQYKNVSKKGFLLDCSAIVAGIVAAVLIIYALVSGALIISFYKDGNMDNFTKLIMPLCVGVPVTAIYFGVYYLLTRRREKVLNEFRYTYKLLTTGAYSYGFSLTSIDTNSSESSVCKSIWEPLLMLQNYKKHNVQIVEVKRLINSPVYTQYKVVIADKGVDGEFVFMDSYELCPPDLCETADFSYLDDVELYPLQSGENDESDKEPLVNE